MRSTKAGRSRSSVRLAWASACVAVALAVGAAAPAGALPTTLLPTPLADRFYVPPADLAAHRPGDVLNARRTPTPIGLTDVDVTQLLFRSTDATGHPIAAVATILSPRNHRVDGPVLSYGGIINATGLQCAPSHAMFDDQLYREDILWTVALNLPLRLGWTVITADHLGPRSSYGAAKLGGQITLDSIRAAQRYRALQVTHSKVGLVGYSGGGMAAAWAAALAPRYAPELRLAGAAVGGVPMNLQKMLDVLGVHPHPAFGLAFAAAIGLEREYPDELPMQSRLNAEGRKLRAEMNDLCTKEILALGVNRSAPQLASNVDLLGAPSTRRVLRENSLEVYAGTPSVPVFEWHSPIDALIPVDSIDATTARWRAAGTSVTTMRTPAPDHLSAAVLGFPQAVQFLVDRLAN